MPGLLAASCERGEFLQQSNVRSVLMGSGQVGKLLGKLIADSLLFEQIHQQVIQITVQHIASNGIDFVIPFSLVDGQLINGEHIVVLALLCLSLQVGTGEGQCRIALNDVYLEARLAAHLTQIGFISIGINLWLLFAVHSVVHIEADYDLLLVCLFGQLNIGATQFYTESIQGAGYSLTLLDLALGNYLLGKELDQLTLACLKKNNQRFPIYFISNTH